MGAIRLSHAEQINRLAEQLTKTKQVDCPVKHYFAPGVYAREITIPAGTALIGAMHKTQNLVILSKGKLRLATENGPITISAPHTLTVMPGKQNAAVALEDSVWTNFFATTETDLEKLVEILSESTADQIIGGAKNQQMLDNIENKDLLCHLQL